MNFGPVTYISSSSSWLEIDQACPSTQLSQTINQHQEYSKNVILLTTKYQEYNTNVINYSLQPSRLISEV